MAPNGTSDTITLVRRAQFGKLLVGQSVSAFGDWMATIALMALVLDLTGSSTAVGAILVLRLAPTAFAGPLATRLVRRWNRRRTMMAMDLARVGVVFAIPLVHTLWWVYLWAFVLEVGGLIFLPARDAAIPELAEGEDVTLANSLILASSYGMIPIGAGAFSLLSAFVGEHHAVFVLDDTTVALWADAVTFLVSFELIRRIRPFEGGDQDQPDEAPERTPFLSGFRLPLVRVIAAPAIVASLGIGTLFSLGIVFVRDVLDASNIEFGLLVALFGVGAAVGLVALRAWGVGGIGFIRWTIGAQGVVIAGMSAAPTVAVAFVGAVLFGATTSAALTAAMSELQERLSGEDRVRAFTVFHVLIRAGLATAALGAGAAADLLGNRRWPILGEAVSVRLVLFGSGMVVLVAALATGRLAAGVVGSRRADAETAP